MKHFQAALLLTLNPTFEHKDNLANASWNGLTLQISH